MPAGLKVCEDASLEELEEGLSFRDARSLTTWSDYHRSHDRMLRNLHVAVFECQGQRRFTSGNKGNDSLLLNCIGRRFPVTRHDVNAGGMRPDKQSVLRLGVERQGPDSHAR